MVASLSPLHTSALALRRMAESHSHGGPGGAQLAGTGAVGVGSHFLGVPTPVPLRSAPPRFSPLPQSGMEPLLTELYSLKSPQGPPAQAISGKREAVPRLPWERRGDNVRAEGPYQVSVSFVALPLPWRWVTCFAPLSDQTFVPFLGYPSSHLGKGQGGSWTQRPPLDQSGPSPWAQQPPDPASESEKSLGTPKCVCGGGDSASSSSPLQAASTSSPPPSPQAPPPPSEEPAALPAKQTNPFTDWETPPQPVGALLPSCRQNPPILGEKLGREGWAGSAEDPLPFHPLQSCGGGGPVSRPLPVPLPPPDLHPRSRASGWSSVGGSRGAVRNRRSQERSVPGR